MQLFNRQHPGTLVDRRIDPPLEKLEEDAYRVLSQRHDRIRSELRTTLATVIGISGAVITLSLTLLEKFAPKRLYPGLLVTAWAAFGLAVVISLGFLFDMTMRSIRHQDTLGRLYKEGRLKIFFHFGGGTPGGNYFYAVTEKFPGEAGTSWAVLVCAIGVLCSVAFGALNLMAGR